MANKRNLFLLSAVIVVLASISIQFRYMSTAAAAVLSSPFVTEYPLPNAGAPRYLVQDTNGHLWFTAPGTNAIGRLVYTSTVDYAYTFYNIPTPNSEPYDLAATNTTIWFTELAGNKIGKLTIATGVIEEFTIPTAVSAPTGITVLPDGTVWFVQRTGNKLGTFNPVTQSFTEYAYPRAGALLEDIAATQSGGRVWFTAPGVQRIGSFTLSNAQFYDVPTASYGLPPYTPSQLAVDPVGDPWVSTTTGLIGRFMPSTVQLFRWYQVAPTETALNGLLLKVGGGKNELWFTESNTGFAGQFMTNSGGSTISKWRLPITQSNNQLYGIVIAADSAIWVADHTGNKLLRWSPPYFYSAYLPYLSNKE